MKQKLFFALLFFAAVACTSDIDTNRSNTEELFQKSFVISSANTKATIGNNLKVDWEIGDTFSVYDPIAGKGQKFTVKEVNNGKAVITGSISKGDFKFSAVYPYEVVTAWNGYSDCTIQIPTEQVVPEGKNADPKAFISGAFNENPDGNISMNSLYSLISFNVAKNGINEVEIALKSSSDGDAKTYSIKSTGKSFAKGTYYALVNPGTYAGGIKAVCKTGFDVSYTKETSKSFTLGKSQSIDLGTLTDGKRYVKYKITSQSSISTVTTLIKNTKYYSMAKSMSGYSTAVIDLVIGGYVTDYLGTAQLETVNTYNITYTSAGIDGNPMTLSAKVYIPKKASSSKRKLNGLILASRATITKNEECPTESEQAEGALAWKNYAVVMPDFYGFGASSDLPQAYINSGLTGRNNIDAVIAAQQLIGDLNLTMESNLINLGYSQGGMAAVASLKHAAENPDNNIVFNKTLAGGGPYDFNICYDNYVTGAYPEASRFIIISAISLNESEHMGLNYAHIFKEPLLSNYSEWILSKNYSTTEIMDFIGDDTPLDEIIDEGIIKQTSSEAKLLKKAMASHALTGGITIPDGTELILLHSTKDDYVPYENYEELLPSLSGGKITTYSGDYGNHLNGALKFVEVVIDKL